MPNLPVLDRVPLDVVRALQAVIVAIALSVDFGKYEGVEESIVTLISVVLLGAVTRNSVTPVKDPAV